MDKNEYLEKIVRQSRYMVAVCSSGLAEESGIIGMRMPSRAYDIEKKYGYSPEEIFSEVFFNTRPELFFDFYRDELLVFGNEKPGKAFGCLKLLEEKRILKSIVTNNIYGLARKAGCKNVIELHGNMEYNKCKHCQAEYDSDYIRDSKNIPTCERCGAVIRPQVLLFGAMVDNRTMTRAINEIAKADVLLVLGKNLKSDFAVRYVKNFQGNKLVLINNEEHYSDGIADLVFHEPCGEVLEKLVKEL